MLWDIDDTLLTSDHAGDVPAGGPLLEACTRVCGKVGVTPGVAMGQIARLGAAFWLVIAIKKSELGLRFGPTLCYNLLFGQPITKKGRFGSELSFSGKTGAPATAPPGLGPLVDTPLHPCSTHIILRKRVVTHSIRNIGLHGRASPQNSWGQPYILN